MPLLSRDALLLYELELLNGSSGALRVIMRPETEQPRWGPELCMARAGFKHDILRIVLSDRDAPLE